MTYKFLFIVLFVFLSLIFLGKAYFDSSTSLGEAEDVAPEQSLNRPSDVVETEGVETEAPVAGSNQRESVVAPKDLSNLDIEAWEQERGFVSSDLRSTYATYGFETLIELGKQGDVLAVEMLASTGMVDNPIDLLSTAAARGSVSALNTRTIVTENLLSAYKKGEIDESEARQKLGLDSKAAIEKGAVEIILVDAVLMKIRGDIARGDLVLMMTQNNIMQRQLSSDEIAWVHGEAIKQYELLSALRAQLGYDEFNNNYPPSYAGRYGLPDNNTYLDSLKSGLNN